MVVVSNPAISITACSSPATLLSWRAQDEQRQLLAALVDASETGVLVPARIGSACVSERRSCHAYGLLVSCGDPAYRIHRSGHYNAYWPELAPRPELAALYYVGHISWCKFAERYRSQLNGMSGEIVLRLVALCSDMSSRYQTVQFLGERRAPGGDELLVRDPRVVVRWWLLDGVQEARQIAREQERRRTWERRWCAA